MHSFPSMFPLVIEMKLYYSKNILRFNSIFSHDIPCLHLQIVSTINFNSLEALDRWTQSTRDDTLGLKSLKHIGFSLHKCSMPFYDLWQKRFTIYKCKYLHVQTCNEITMSSFDKSNKSDLFPKDIFLLFLGYSNT